MKLTSLLFILSFLISAQISGQTTVTLSPSKDNTLFEDSTLSNGSGQYLFVGKTSQQSNSLRRVLIAFPIADSIPAGSVIESVSLTMNMSKSVTEATSVALHRVEQDWGEGASDAADDEGKGVAAQSGDATWARPFFDSTVTWTNAGGDFATMASASVNVSTPGSYTWTDSLMAVDVQGWLDSAASNFGWIMIGNESANANAKRFDSKENGMAANRPALTVTYTMASAIRSDKLLPLKIYPNPASDIVRIELPEIGEASIQLLDIRGKLIHSITTREANRKIDLQQLPAGIYWIRLQQDGKYFGTKVLKR